MKISESWLREWVNPELNTAELSEQMTMAGLEVDGVEPVSYTHMTLPTILRVYSPGLPRTFKNKRTDSYHQHW